jgi:hypothetical protein
MSLLTLHKPPEEQPKEPEAQMSKRQFGMLRRQIEETEKSLRRINKKRIIRENKCVYALRNAARQLEKAERHNDSKAFHKWFRVMVIAYHDLERYIAEDADETRSPP